MIVVTGNYANYFLVVVDLECGDQNRRFGIARSAGGGDVLSAYD